MHNMHNYRPFHILTYRPSEYVSNQLILLLFSYLSTGLCTVIHSFKTPAIVQIVPFVPFVYVAHKRASQGGQRGALIERPSLVRASRQASQVENMGRICRTVAQMRLTLSNLRLVDKALSTYSYENTNDCAYYANCGFWSLPCSLDQVWRAI